MRMENGILIQIPIHLELATGALDLVTTPLMQDIGWGLATGDDDDDGLDYGESGGDGPGGAGQTEARYRRTPAWRNGRSDRR